MTPYLFFKELHHQPEPLLLGNVWDVQSAKMYETLHFKAIGTSSAAIAKSLGYDDGENMPFEELLFIVRKIRQATRLPLSVDIEAGYGKNADEVVNNIHQLYELGVAGINIEDSVVIDNQRIFEDAVAFSNKLKAVKQNLAARAVDIFINVRCDAYLLNTAYATEEALSRIHLYEQVGIEGIFLPGITKEEDIEKVVRNTGLPVNVMCMPGLPNFDTLQALGVKRISMGNFLNDYASKNLQKVTQNIVEEKSFSLLL